MLFDDIPLCEKLSRESLAVHDGKEVRKSGAGTKTEFPQRRSSKNLDLRRL